MDGEKTGRKQRGRPFAPGTSGNPAGRPKGARNRATVAAEALLEGEAEALTRKAVELALAGDVTALRLCLERLLPPRKDRAVAFDMPAVAKADDAARGIGAVLAAVADGTIAPREASAVAGLIEAQRRASGADVVQAPPAVQLNVSFVSAESRPESVRACISPRRVAGICRPPARITSMSSLMRRNHLRDRTGRSWQLSFRQTRSIVFMPPIYDWSTSGTAIVPSACW
jgi:Family of unknown function (DUF5681)